MTPTAPPPQPPTLEALQRQRALELASSVDTSPEKVVERAEVYYTFLKGGSDAGQV